MSSRGSTTAATAAFSSPTRYDAHPRSSCVIWRKTMSARFYPAERRDASGGRDGAREEASTSSARVAADSLPHPPSAGASPASSGPSGAPLDLERRVGWRLAGELD